MIKNIGKCVLLCCVAILVATSCGNIKNVKYFQDTADQTLLPTDSLSAERPIRVKPGDKLNIIVNSRDYQLTNMFNLPYTAKVLGAPMEVQNNSYSQGIMGYTVSPDGNVDIPVLGNVKVEGLTRTEISELVRYRLAEANLLQDAVVTVEFVNLKVDVLGEVNAPGTYYIDRDKYTVLDAVAAAKDFTICGERGNVKVIREEPEGKKVYEMDFCKMSSVMSSPAFYLCQNDVVYVSPNKMRSRQSTVNGNELLSASFWISVLSLLMTLLVYLGQLGLFSQIK